MKKWPFAIVLLSYLAVIAAVYISGERLIAIIALLVIVVLAVATKEGVR